MPVQYVNSGTEGSAASGNITLGAPASPVNGDVWIAVVHSSDQVAHTFTDWTQIVQGNGGGTTSRLSVWFFRYNGSTPNLIVGHTGGQSPIGGIAAYRGVKSTGNPYDVAGTVAGGTDASLEHTAISTTVTGCMILACNGSADDNNRSTLPTDYRARFEDTAASTQNCFQTTAGTPDGSVALHDKIQAATGTTGTVTDTQAASDPWAAVLVALAPEPVGQVTETDTAQAITRVKSNVLGQPSVTNAAQAVAWAPKRRLAGQVSETETVGTPATLTDNTQVFRHRGGSSVGNGYVLNVTESEIGDVCNVTSQNASQTTIQIDPLATTNATVYAALASATYIEATVSNGSLYAGSGGTFSGGVRSITPVKSRTVEQASSSAAAAQAISSKKTALVGGRSTATKLLNEEDAVDRTSYTTSSISPVARKFYLVWVHNFRVISPTIPTLSGNGISWSQVATATYNGATARGTLFCGMSNGTPTAGSITINFSGATQTYCQWQVVEVDNVDNAGLNPVVSSTSNSTESGTSLTLILTPSSTLNSVLAFGSTPNLPSYTPESGFTELNDALGETCVFRAYGNDGTVLIDPSGTNPIIGIAVEIRTGSCALEIDAAQVVTWAPKIRLVSTIAEADTSQAVVTVKSHVLVQVDEVDAADTIAEPAGITEIVGLASEADASQVTTARKTQVVVQSSEADSAQGATSSKVLQFAQSTEVDSAQAATAKKTVSVVQSSETDFAGTTTWAPKNRLVAQAGEADSSQATTARKAKAVDQSAEADSAGATAWAPKNRLVSAPSTLDASQAFSSRKSLTTVQSTEADSSATVSSRKTKQVVQVQEADAAQPVARAYLVPVVQVQETDAAQATSSAKRKLVDFGVEVDEAQTISVRGRVASVFEVDSASSVSSRKTSSVSPSTESDLAQGAAPDKRRTVLASAEADSSAAFSVRRRYSVASSPEVDFVQVVTSRKTLAVSSCTEADAAQATTGRKAKGLGQVVEVDSSLSLGEDLVAVVSRAIESDAAFSVTPLGGEGSAVVVERLDLVGIVSSGGDGGALTGSVTSSVAEPVGSVTSVGES